MYVNDYESSECDSGSTGQLAANKLYNLVDLTVAFHQKALFSSDKHAYKHAHIHACTKVAIGEFLDHSVEGRKWKGRQSMYIGSISLWLGRRTCNQQVVS